MRTSVPNPQMRVSDSERSEVADTLSKHFSEGRLDQAELDERLHRAMSAKTRADFTGLMDDLPTLAQAPDQTQISPRRGRGRFALLLIASALFAMAVSATMWILRFPWFLFAIVFFFAWRRFGPRGQHGGWHYHRHLT
jgi:hypothetical protein